MPIPAVHAHRYIYHFTHISNLPTLIQQGLLATNHPQFPAARRRSIAAATIQERRAAMAVPCGNGGVVHDYVPFYFSPMLLSVVNKKNIDQRDILYLEFPISILRTPGAVFSDASANANTLPNFYTDLSMLNALAWGEIDSIRWSSSIESKRLRMAEALIPAHVPLHAAARIVVWNETVKAEVEEILQRHGIQHPPVDLENPQRRHFFVKFNAGDENGMSLVTGPSGIARAYSDACTAIGRRGAPAPNARFAHLDALLTALRADFGSLAQTAELIGLRSENGVHRYPVDQHTQHVVERLLGMPELSAMHPSRRSMLELAAYLHDIGKGPRARWADNGGVQKVDPDHPVRAMKMMVDIFHNDIVSANESEVRLLLKLVCYHDLVGEILGKERQASQLIDVAADTEELDMLFALGKADATSLSEAWWDEQRASALYNDSYAAINTRMSLAR
jgi:hypothetical protein